MRAVFVNPTGQLDNIGDSVLRRVYLEALRTKGVLHVLTTRDEAYNSGLGLGPSDVVYESRASWLANAVLHAVRRRLTFAVNAGEFVGRPSDKLRSTWQVFLAAIARASGGEVVLAGVSVRPGTSPSSTHLRQLARLSTFVSWRDAATLDAFGVGEVQPDWAFRLGGECGEGDRRFLAVALRGDRPLPSSDWARSVREFALERGVEIRVAVQVRRDSDAAREIATLLGAEVVEWPSDVDHAGQEKTIRELYRKSRFIVSDRIHALIIALTEGVLPVGVARADSTKIVRTFEQVSPLGLMHADSGIHRQDQWQPLIDCGQAVQNGLPTAQKRIDEIFGEFARPRG